MMIIIPQRHLLELEYKSRIYSKSFLGDPRDSTNFTITEASAWNATKQDYKIEDRVTIPLLQCEYICGENGNTQYPPSSSSWKDITLNEYKYADTAPNRKSYKVDSEDIVIESHLGQNSNFLFIQNTSGIKRIKVEAYNENGDMISLNGDGEYMEKITSFSCANCCETKIENKINFTQNLLSCGGFSKIKTTLYPYGDQIGKIGTHAIGEAIALGCLSSYPTSKINSTSKFTVKENELEIAEGSKYIELDVKFIFKKEDMNFIVSKLSENIGKICFYDLEEFKEIDMIKVTGFHKSFDIDIETNEISMHIYGVPSY